ncbi:MAG: hypothetical protein J1F61_03710 [Clostridiales bacterium]|nr:hypothetical protein [Clostridiales bacterium]
MEVVLDKKLREIKNTGTSIYEALIDIIYSNKTRTISLFQLTKDLEDKGFYVSEEVTAKFMSVWINRGVVIQIKNGYLRKYT